MTLLRLWRRIAELVVLDHVDRVPVGLVHDLIDGVRAVFDQGPHGAPAAAVVAAQERALFLPVFASLILEIFLEPDRVDRVHGQHAPRDAADADGDHDPVHAAAQSAAGIVRWNAHALPGPRAGG